MIWRLAHRADRRCLPLADRHYNRQKIGSPQFVPPGGCAVFIAETPTGKAVWVTSTPLAKYVKHRWPGAWVNSLFRNEGAGVASALIVQALAASRYEIGDPPERGIVTFVDPREVKPTIVRGVRTWGRIYLLAGFEEDGETKGHLLAFRMPPERFPAAEAPIDSQLALA
jgi:hypothetical protein